LSTTPFVDTASVSCDRAIATVYHILLNLKRRILIPVPEFPGGVKAAIGSFCR
jgi:hypothetical protein